MGLEGGYAIDEAGKCAALPDMGVRYMSPAWSVSTVGPDRRVTVGRTRTE